MQVVIEIMELMTEEMNEQDEGKRGPQKNPKKFHALWRGRRKIRRALFYGSYQKKLMVNSIKWNSFIKERGELNYD